MTRLSALVAASAVLLLATVGNPAPTAAEACDGARDYVPQDSAFGDV